MQATAQNYWWQIVCDGVKSEQTEHDEFCAAVAFDTSPLIPVVAVSLRAIFQSQFPETAGQATLQLGGLAHHLRMVLPGCKCSYKQQRPDCLHALIPGLLAVIEISELGLRIRPAISSGRAEAVLWSNLCKLSHAAAPLLKCNGSGGVKELQPVLVFKAMLSPNSGYRKEQLRGAFVKAKCGQV